MVKWINISSTSSPEYREKLAQALELLSSESKLPVISEVFEWVRKEMAEEDSDDCTLRVSDFVSSLLENNSLPNDECKRFVICMF